MTPVAITDDVAALDMTSLRGALFILVLTAVVLLVLAQFTALRQRHWTLRIVAIGVLGSFLYALVGQTKAVKFDIPFDHTSWIGLVSFAVIDFGLSCAVLRSLWSGVIDPDRK